jgi:hypothetical protein
MLCFPDSFPDLLRSIGSKFTPLHQRFWGGLDGGFRFWGNFSLVWVLFSPFRLCVGVVFSLLGLSC